MGKYLLLLLCATAFSVAAMLAQTLPSTLPNLGKRGYIMPSQPAHQTARRSSYVGGKEYLCILEEERVGPEWESSGPLPVALAKVEKITRTELRKLAADEPRWLVTDFQISRFGRGPNWYYVITLKPDVEVAGLRAEVFTLLVDFSGKPGRVGRLVSPQARQ